MRYLVCGGIGMAAVITALVFCSLSAALMFGLGRRKRQPCAVAAVVILCGRDKKAAQKAVKAYYYEELFERAELRRRIFLLCDEESLNELSELEERYPLVKVTAKSDLSLIIRHLEKGS